MLQLDILTAAVGQTLRVAIRGGPWVGFNGLLGLKKSHDAVRARTTKGTDVSGTEIHVEQDKEARTASFACLGVGNYTMAFLVAAGDKPLASVEVSLV